MNFWDHFLGSVCIVIKSADIPGTILYLTDHNIILENIQILDEVTASICVSRKDYYKTLRLIKRRGNSAAILKETGLYWLLKRVKKRMIFIIGIIFILFLTLYIPSRVFFYEVIGNEKISEYDIIDYVQRNGLEFGAKRKDVRNQQIKNGLLTYIPQLEWAAVTTKGCVATVHIREKTVQQEDPLKNGPVGNIVATTDGVVEQVTATKGVALCAPGQAVQKGDILISGYEDCGILIKASRAEGEITAKTSHNLFCVTPAQYQTRLMKTGSKVSYRLQIGKNIINFDNNSGISPTECVKMYSRKYLTLPGGFQLPIAWITEQCDYYTICNSQREETACHWMQAYSDQYLLGQMLGGQIQQKNYSLQFREIVWILNSNYACTEQIGIFKPEEIKKYYGKNS